MIRAFTALTLNGFREARRNRISIVVAAFTLALLLASHLAIEVTVVTFQRVLTDLGLGGMAIALTFLSIFLSTGMLTREIERRTLFLIVSKPITRGLFLLGRTAGNMLTLTVLLMAMSLLFFAQLLLHGFPISAPTLTAIAMLLLELFVISSIGVLLSSFASQLVAAVVTTGVFFAGHLSSSIYSLATSSPSQGLRFVGKLVYYLLPNLSRLNYRPQAAYELVSPAGEVLRSALYGATFGGVALALAILIFQRRDFR